MATYSTANMLGANLALVYTPSTDLYPYTGENPFAVGQVTTGTDGSSWVWVLAEEDLGQYDAVAISEAFIASQATDTEADDSWKFGVASQVAIPDGSYGWVQTRGPTTVFVTGSCAPDVPLFVSVTAGAITDNTTVGTRIKGIVTTTTNSVTTKAAVAAFMPIEPFYDFA